MNRRGLAFKLSLLIVAGGILVLALIFGYNYVFSRRVIVRNVEESAGNLTRATVNQVAAVLSATEKVPEQLAIILEQTSLGEAALGDLLRRVVEENPEIYGATIAFEPYAFDPTKEYFAPYYYRRAGELHYASLAEPSYHYVMQDWYQIPHETGQPEWSEPYYDEGGGETVMSTYSVPFFGRVDGERRVRGIVTADISLDWLTALMSSIRVLDTGYAFLISRNGVVVTHPDRSLVMNETLFGIAEARGKPELRRIGRAMIRGESGFIPTDCVLKDDACWLAYAPIAANGWALAALFPRRELFADIDQLNRTVFALAFGGALFLLFIVVTVSRSITRPLVALAQASEEIAQGNLENDLPSVRARDEIGRLAEAFARMQRDLRRHIADLRETSAARERAAAELAEYSRTLEEKVASRTSEIRDKNAALEKTLVELEQTQGRLIAQEKLASLGSLTAGIAHEIKNPLNFVNNFAALSVDLAGDLQGILETRRDALPPDDRAEVDDILADLKQNVAKIRAHGLRADRIVRSMLEHSREASGERRSTDLNELLADAVTLAFHSGRTDDSMALEKDYAKGLPPVAAVPEDLARVLANALGNAFDALDEKRRRLGGAFKPVIRVATRDLGDRIELRIRDNGIGIPADLLGKVFEPFFTTKPAGQGTGLGLSISHDIVVRQHGGELRMESEDGEYAELVIVLPREAT